MKTPKCRKSLWFRFVTALMVLLMIEINPVPRSAAATDQPPQPGPQPHYVMECVFAVCVIAVGTIIVYNLYKCAKKNLPPNPPPPPPPPVPPPSTNAPPATNHLVIRPLDGIPPFPTNNPPDTNYPSTNAVVVSYWIPPAWTNLPAQSITNDAADGGNYYDISGLGYTDTNGLAPTPWWGFISDTFSNVQSSTNLMVWSNYSFNMWLSSNGTETVVYDGSGFPVTTNYDFGDPTQGGPTNAYATPLGIWINNGEEPNKFFRLLLSP